MNWRTKAYFLAVMAMMAIPAMALANEGHASASGAAAHEAVPVPLNPSWISGLLVVVLWIVVAAVLLGPLVMYFRLLPRTTQLFADEHGGHDTQATHSAHAAPATHH